MIDRRRFLGLAAGATVAPLAFPQTKGKLEITSVEAYPVKLWSRSSQGALPKFKGPYDIQRWRYTGPYSQLASAMMVVIKTNQGLTGFGLGGGGAAGAQIVEGHLRNLLVGMNPLDVELLWDQMYTSSLMYGRGGVFVMALSGVDNALWDLAGKYMEQPVYRLLGGTTKQKAEVYFTSADPEAGMKLGMKNFKIPVREGVHEGRAGMDRMEGVLREARQTIGDEKRLMLECGLKWDDVTYVKEMAKRLEDVRLYFIEEPLSPNDIFGYAELVREIDGPMIASGEHEYTQHGFRMLMHHKAVEVVQPDVTWCGGVTAIRKVAAMCSERRLVFLPHRGGSAYGLPLVLSSPDAPMAESFGTGDDASDLMTAMTSRYEDGYYYPSEKPGFGTEITEEMVKRHAI